VRSWLALPIALLASCHLTVTGELHGIHQLERSLDIEVEESHFGTVVIVNRGADPVTLQVDDRSFALAAGATFTHPFGADFGSLQVQNAGGRPVTVEYDVSLQAFSPRIRVVGR
jgi:hypothetical protein